MGTMWGISNVELRIEEREGDAVYVYARNVELYRVKWGSSLKLKQRGGMAKSQFFVNRMCVLPTDNSDMIAVKIDRQAGCILDVDNSM